jgi:chemotaxis protein methyltransferase CheR
MTPAEFEILAQLLKRRSGIALAPDRMRFAVGRLTPLAALYGFKDAGALVRTLQDKEALAVAATEALTTSDSSFFRDKQPFDCFRDVLLPSLIKQRARDRRLRIWSAGAARGQEPYSLAMILEEMRQQMPGWTIDVLATDMNAEFMASAKEGVYDRFEVQRGLPAPMLARHFRREGDNWRLSNSIRQSVEFRVFNLLDTFAGLGPFDIIFCRNVLIYFDAKTKDDVARRLVGCLAHDGYLVLGVAETALDLNGALAPLPQARSIYVKSQAFGVTKRATAAA